MERVELQIHTKMSKFDGIASVEEYIEKAKKLGMKSIAITDHGVVQAFPEAQRYLERIGDMDFKIIYGMEGYFINDEKKENQEFHISILVKNRMGLINLYKLVSYSHLDYFYKTPRIIKKILSENREGLLIGSACKHGELYNAILNEKSKEEIEKIADYYDYLEVQPTENNNDINKKIIKLGKKLNKLVVASGNVHFLNREDEIYRKIIQWNQGNINLEKKSMLYFRTTEEMLKEFDYLGKEEAYEIVVKNTNLVADMCQKISPISNEKCYPYIPDCNQTIKELAYNKVHELYGEKLKKEVETRLLKELDIIIKNNFSSLYLIAQKLASKSNEDGYLVGSRGSIASSFVAYLIGITEVNPLKPHYRCTNCKYSDFSDYGFKNGFDLPDKNCPKCRI